MGVPNQSHNMSIISCFEVSEELLFVNAIWTHDVVFVFDNKVSLEPLYQCVQLYLHISCCFVHHTTYLAAL